MGETVIGEATLDECGTCGGRFFDQGEMFAAFGLDADPSYWDRPETGGTVRDGNFKCPRCGSPTLAQDVTLGEHHVEIDRCGHCRGIWLDKGEVETIMRIGQENAEAVAVETAKARADLASVTDDFSSPGLISRFLKLFQRG